MTSTTPLGAGLAGVPIPGIAFTDQVAWSFTVSRASPRFTLYELELNPDNPMEYLYDGEPRAIESRSVTAEQVLEDGSVETVEHTFYFSHYGPIVDLGSVSPLLGGWPNAAGTLLTYRDANLDNLRTVEQLVRMGQADNLEQLEDALVGVGLPYFVTTAADREGNAYAGNISAIPHVSSAQYNNCIRGFLQNQLTELGLVTLDGGDPLCEWGSDEGVPDGIFGFTSLPGLNTRDYVANANGSHWLTNPRQLLEGFSPVIGAERSEQTMRTRHAFYMAELRLQGLDGLDNGRAGLQHRQYTGDARPGHQLRGARDGGRRGRYLPGYARLVCVFQRSRQYARGL